MKRSVLSNTVEGRDGKGSNKSVAIVRVASRATYIGAVSHLLEYGVDMIQIKGYQMKWRVTPTL
jgi:hypothetical protein